MEKIYNLKQIRALEQQALTELKTSEDTLMRRAGSAAFSALTARFKHAGKILVVCGSGNNGGDGYVLAALAKDFGLEVVIVFTKLPTAKQVAAYQAYQRCVTLAIPMHVFSETARLTGYDVVVDALLGIGLAGEVSGLPLLLIKAMNAQVAPIFSLDVPSGLAVNTGCVCGEAVRAAVTITFIGKKIGMCTGSAPEYCGDILVDTLQLPDECFAALSSPYELIEQQDLSDVLISRRRDAHKGSFGHVLVVGGDLGFAGAARLAGEAAARCGAGLVSIATRPEHIALMTARCPELMAHGIESTKQFEQLLEKATVVILGPGLGQSKWSQTLWQVVMEHPHKPMVVDADALNTLAQRPMQNDLWILTPHPGEAGRLLNTSAQEINADRVFSVRALQQRYGGTAVLKGAGTLISAQGGHISICPYGNPGMASGGMGDVLSGVIGGLLAQGFTVEAAARFGVLIHAMAGDLAAQMGERGMLASDVIDTIRQVVNRS